MSKVKRSGVCKLTQAFGPYVDSHIIPQALTRLSRTGEPYVEVEIGSRTKKRCNSWYDGTLVTRAGEDILAAIDSKAISELRAHRLVWSGWAGEQRLRSDDIIYLDDKPSLRAIKLEQADALRIFFLSLLWRAAASSRPEFGAITLQDSVAEDLRDRVLKQEPGAPADYPIQLFQIITRGIEHNRTPLIERKPIPAIDGSFHSDVAYARFYLDGLVAHIHILSGQEVNSDYLNTCLGFQDQSLVFLYEWDGSRASENLKTVASAVGRK